MKIIDIMPRVLPPKPGKKNKRHPSNSERAQKLVEFLTTNCGWTVLNRGTSKVLDTLIDNICEDIYDTYNTEGKSFSFAFLKNPANPNVTMYIDTDKLLAIKDIKKSTADNVLYSDSGENTVSVHYICSPYFDSYEFTQDGLLVDGEHLTAMRIW